MFAESQEEKAIGIDDLEAALRLLANEITYEKSRPTVTIGLLGVIYSITCVFSLVTFLIDLRTGYYICFIAILALFMLVIVLIRTESRLGELIQLQINLEERRRIARGKSPVAYLYGNEVVQLASLEQGKLTRLVQVGLRNWSENESNWYSVALLPDVIDTLKQLRESERKAYDTIKDLIDSLQSEPSPIGAQLIDSHNQWEVRVGRYSIIYRIDDTNKRLEIIKINQASGAEVNHAV